MKNVIWIFVAVIAASLFVVQNQKFTRLQAEAANFARLEAVARQEAQRAADAAKPDPAEEERIKAERAELIKLRGEVSALRAEKAVWEKKNRAAAEAAALEASKPKAVVTTPTTEGMQWVETILNGPALVKGTEAGNVRRKFLNREPLTEAEQALLLNMMNKAGEIEKSPAEFAQFQSAFIGSLLNWNNDPRMEQVQAMINRASEAALNRGFDYHAPAQNAENWDDGQKALNARATGGVQKLLTPEEREVFDKAFLGVLGIDFGIGVVK